MKLIDKSTLVAELENRIKRIAEHWKTSEGLVTSTGRGILEAYRSILCFINTVEIKDVDLEEALSNLDKDIKEFVATEEFEKESKMSGHYWAIAKHAFLLGIKAQNENNEPIPLTLEFFKENGYHTTPVYDVDDESIVYTHIDLLGEWTWYNGKIYYSVTDEEVREMFECKYVHEFQCFLRLTRGFC